MPAHGTLSISSSYITLTFNDTDCSASILEVNYDMRCYCLKQSYFSLKKAFSNLFYYLFILAIFICANCLQVFTQVFYFEPNPLHPSYYLKDSQLPVHYSISFRHFGRIFFTFVTFIFCTTMNVHAILIVKLFIFIFL